MASFLRRGGGAAPDEGGGDELGRQREAVAEELERLKRELTERVLSVHAKERQLDEALARASGAAPPAPPVASGQAAALDARERALAVREAAVAERERSLADQERALAEQAAPPSGPDPAGELARLDARLAELREAERIFLRTREEIAARSEAVAARERLVAERERELDALEDEVGAGPTRTELAELEARLRRLERGGGAGAGEDTQSFAGGLESLRRRGTRRRI